MKGGCTIPSNVSLYKIPQLIIQSVSMIFILTIVRFSLSDLSTLVVSWCCMIERGIIDGISRKELALSVTCVIGSNNYLAV